VVKGRTRKQKRNGLGIVTPEVVKILEWWRVFCRNVVRSRSDQGLEALPETANDAAPQRLIRRRAGWIGVAHDNDRRCLWRQRNFANARYASRDDDIFGPGRTRRQTLLGSFALNRFRPRRAEAE
jgi:hypothetical protein